MNEIDLVEILFTLFWIFFAFLIMYLHRENKREGYPLDSDRTDRSGGRVMVHGFPRTPDPKTYHLLDGRSVTVPRKDPDQAPPAVPAGRYPGAPLAPTGEPLGARIGPGSWSDRDDVPDHTLHGEDRIVPMRVAEEFVVTQPDNLLGFKRPKTDPRGYPVLGADGEEAGTVADLWVDLCEPMISYFEVALNSGEGRHVLLPIGFSRVTSNSIKVASINADQFAGVPATASPDRITRLEEDKVCAYYAGGTLYATEERQEPLL